MAELLEGSGTTSYISTKGKQSDSKAKIKPAPMTEGSDSMKDKQKDKDHEKDETVLLSRKGTKIGHRRIDEAGQITYKKQPSSALMSAIQLGIQYSVGRLSSKAERDVLMGDFYEIESVFFPSDGRQETPAHHYSDFRFKAYAPVAFRYFRELFHIAPDDFLISLCHEALRELTNPGASGSLFYLSMDDQFIIKTIQHKEAEFLQKLLPGYYLNLNQNKRTLLPKFFGLYCYQCGGKNIRLVVMNNLLPSGYKIHLKYDLKGSTFKRKASKAERAKSSPTLKDLDFMNDHPDGISLDAETYNLLTKTIQRDCRVLESFKIMDYSLLLAIHNVDEAAREKVQARGEPSSTAGTKPTEAVFTSTTTKDDRSEKSTLELAKDPKAATVARNPSARNRDDFAAYWEAIPQHRQDDATPYGAIKARNTKGDRLLLFIGIIDILQSYRLKKRLEHGLKSVVQDGDSISVHRPSFYSQRFQDFMSKKIFRKLPATRPQITRSPSKKRASFNTGKGKERIRTSSDAERRALKLGEHSNFASKHSPSLPDGLSNVVPGDVSFMGQEITLAPVPTKSTKTERPTVSIELTPVKTNEPSVKLNGGPPTSDERSKKVDTATSSYGEMSKQSDNPANISDGRSSEAKVELNDGNNLSRNEKPVIPDNLSSNVDELSKNPEQPLSNIDTLSQDRNLSSNLDSSLNNPDQLPSNPGKPLNNSDQLPSNPDEPSNNSDQSPSSLDVPSNNSDKLSSSIDELSRNGDKSNIIIAEASRNDDIKSSTADDKRTISEHRVPTDDTESLGDVEPTSVDSRF